MVFAAVKNVYVGDVVVSIPKVSRPLLDDKSVYSKYDPEVANLKRQKRLKKVCEVAP